ncbi:pentapeptide repeat-containing protein [Streptomyces otsuchiensis]|uniref:pentapeptide repeat-containing protein n=1 Tax=Streptomyces otsuchiensis TaxID=2681388 RepID=UPI00130023C9|nr:pentapeptide repeat-containing protein [Streptomyces otsuchiensis]
MGQFRLAIVQVVAAVGAGIALTYTARTFRLSRRGQVTDRFTKALERLSSDEVYVRIGGVLAMEQIVQDAPDQGEHAARVLNAFVRRHAPDAAATALDAAQLPKKPEEQVQEALRALTVKRSWRGGRHRPVDLAGLHLKGAQLQGAYLQGALVKGATLAEADLRGANLKGADLADTDLTRANLSTARGLEEAQLLKAGILRGCRLPDSLADRPEIADRVGASE